MYADIEGELDRLVQEAEDLLRSLEDSEGDPARPVIQRRDPKTFDIDPANPINPRFASGYDSWYSVAQSLVRRVIPERHAEFVSHYDSDTPRSFHPGTDQYLISDYLLDRRAFLQSDGGELSVTRTRVVSRMRRQLAIIHAARSCFRRQLIRLDTPCSGESLRFRTGGGEGAQRKWVSPRRWRRRRCRAGEASD